MEYVSCPKCGSKRIRSNKCVDCQLDIDYYYREVHGTVPLENNIESGSLSQKALDRLKEKKQSLITRVSEETDFCPLCGLSQGMNNICDCGYEFPKKIILSTRCQCGFPKHLINEKCPFCGMKFRRKIEILRGSSKCDFCSKTLSQEDFYLCSNCGMEFFFDETKLAIALGHGLIVGYNGTGKFSLKNLADQLKNYKIGSYVLALGFMYTPGIGLEIEDLTLPNRPKVKFQSDLGNWREVKYAIQQKLLRFYFKEG